MCYVDILLLDVCPLFDVRRSDADAYAEHSPASAVVANGEHDLQRGEKISRS
jgi:hypothetical protein